MLLLHGVVELCDFVCARCGCFAQLLCRKCPSQSSFALLIMDAAVAIEDSQPLEWQMVEGAGASEEAAATSGEASGERTSAPAAAAPTTTGPAEAPVARELPYRIRVHFVPHGAWNAMTLKVQPGTTYDEVKRYVHKETSQRMGPYSVMPVPHMHRLIGRESGRWYHFREPVSVSGPPIRGSVPVNPAVSRADASAGSGFRVEDVVLPPHAAGDGGAQLDIPSSFGAARSSRSTAPNKIVLLDPTTETAHLHENLYLVPNDSFRPDRNIENM